mgnify:FL=1
MRRIQQCSGQAGIEFVGAVPVLAVGMMCGWQLGVAGHAYWKVAETARLAARAQYVADQRGSGDGLARGRTLAATLLASSPASSRTVVAVPGNGVKVSARVPLVAPFRAALGPGRGPRLSATSRMRP